MLLLLLISYVVDVITTVSDGIANCQPGWIDGYECDVWQMEWSLSAIYISGHAVTIDNLSIVGREDQNIKRAIKEALCIRRNNPSLNKNIGKYHMPHIWDEVLVNITELQLT